MTTPLDTGRKWPREWFAYLAAEKQRRTRERAEFNKRTRYMLARSERKQRGTYTTRDKLDDIAGAHQWRHDGRGYTP